MVMKVLGQKLDTKQLRRLGNKSLRSIGIGLRKGGRTATKVAPYVTAAGMYTANPYLIGAGGAMGAYGDKVGRAGINIEKLRRGKIDKVKLFE